MKKASGRRSLLILLIAVAAAVAVGLSGRLLPAAFTQAAADKVLSPLQQTFYRFLSSLACPLIFLCVATGICGIGDARRLGRIGNRLVLSFFGISFLMAAFTTLAGVLLYRLPLSLSASSDTAGSSASAVFDLLLAIVPKDIFSPFAEGNTLQIIFLGIVLGLAMLFIGEQAESLKKVLDSLSLVLQKIMGFLSRIMPVYVFIAVLKMFWGNALSGLKSLWLLPLLFLGATLLAFLVMWLYTALRTHTGPVKLLRACLPPFLIALSTSSSTAAFDESRRTLSELGLGEDFSGFGLPLCMIMYKPASVIYLAVVACFFALNYGLVCSPLWFFSELVLCVMLAFAIPPVPGGGLNNYAILFLQLGIPDSALAVALAADSLFEFIITGFNVLMQPFELYRLADAKTADSLPQKE